MLSVSKLITGAEEPGDRLRYRTGPRKPVVVVNATKACNLRCRHCYAHATADPADNELTRDEILVLVDNLVWSGRVAAGDDDPATAGVREYLRLMWNDPDFVSSLLPVRDGLGVSLRVR